MNVWCVQSAVRATSAHNVSSTAVVLDQYCVIKWLVTVQLAALTIDGALAAYLVRSCFKSRKILFEFAGFCQAMLCISAADAAMQWLFVCPSYSWMLSCSDCSSVRHIRECCHAVTVRLSVIFVNAVKANKHMFKIFSSSGSHAILVFFVPNVMAYSDGTS